jgi:hypothetical protein
MPRVVMSGKPARNRSLSVTAAGTPNYSSKIFYLILRDARTKNMPR